MGMLFGIVFWLFGVGAAISPIFYAASNHLNDPILMTFTNVYAHHYRDVAIMAVAIVGTAFADGIEAFNRADHRSISALFTGIVLLAVCALGAFVAFDVGPHLTNTHGAGKLPYQILVACVLLSAVIKVMSEYQRG